MDKPCNLFSEISETKDRLLGETFEMYATVNWIFESVSEIVISSEPILTLQPKRVMKFIFLQKKYALKYKLH